MQYYIGKLLVKEMSWEEYIKLKKLKYEANKKTKG